MAVALFSRELLASHDLTCHICTRVAAECLPFAVCMDAHVGRLRLAHERGILACGIKSATRIEGRADKEFLVRTPIEGRELRGCVERDELLHLGAFD